MQQQGHGTVQPHLFRHLLRICMANPIDVRSPSISCIAPWSYDRFLRLLLSVMCSLVSQGRIFNEVRAYLMHCGEVADPYKLAYSSPGKPANTSPTAGAAGTDRNSTVRCTRCWGNGHRWDLPFKFFKCTQCNTRLTSSDLFCPNFANHKEKGTKWVPHRSYRSTSFFFHELIVAVYCFWSLCTSHRTCDSRSESLGH